jgi:hypothetical protein
MASRTFVVCAFGIVVLVAGLFCAVAAAQQDPQGAVTTWPSNEGTAIHYLVSGGSSSKAPDLRCNIAYPSGKNEQLKGAGSAWKDGKTSIIWSFYGGEKGTYQANCFWLMEGGRQIDGLAWARTDFQR